jgi:hypothetical protein
VQCKSFYCNQRLTFHSEIVRQLAFGAVDDSAGYPVGLDKGSLELGLESTTQPWHNARLPPPVDQFAGYGSQQ